MEEIIFEKVDFASAGAIGNPGNRVFMIQGRQDQNKVAVVVEKQQIENLSQQSIEFLDSIAQDFPDEEIATPIEFDNAGHIEDLEPIFRARSMGLIFDPETKLVTLELRESEIETEFYDQYESENEFYTEPDEKVIRLTMTRSQLRAMAVKGNEAVTKGREPCPLCLEPMDLTGHICPRLN